MNALRSFVFFGVVSFLTFSHAKPFKPLAQFAISTILNEFFVQESPKVDVIFFKDEKRKSGEIVSGILRHKNESIAMKIMEGDIRNPSFMKLQMSSILIFDSPKAFKETCNEITWQTHREKLHKHLVYIANASASDIEENIKDGFSIDSVDFLVNETEKSIDLVTSFMFSPQACRSNQLMTINKFLRKTLKWESSTFYPSKYRNFHGCELIVATSEDFEENDCRRQILPTIAHNLNYKIEPKIIDPSVPLLMQLLRDVDLTEVGKRDISRLANDDLIFGPSYALGRATFFVPPGEPYTALEKMFLLFDLEVWIAIIVTLLIALAVIQVVNLMPLKVQNFIYGRYIRTPTFNLVAISLTGAQLKIPGRNFSRFLLMLFIIWSLIFRTCYQSELYKYLQTDMRKPAIKTFDEISDRNMSLIVKASSGVRAKFLDLLGKP